MGKTVILTIEGSMHQITRLGDPKLVNVEIRAEVHTRERARAEFERFLNATDLPEG